MKKLATINFLILIVFLSAVYLPMVYEKIWFDEIEKTHLFYSPVTKEFIFKERIVGKIPPGVREKAEDHHAQICYQKSCGNFISRLEFEKLLPFIFYKNMEIWGLLPLEINGQKFDKQTIKENRRVLELSSRHITGNGPETPVWPLLESNPGQARLVFPDDRFRLTDTAMEFINADLNKVDPKLTDQFTRALRREGFVFPSRSVNGKFTILKPFDEGVFIVDDQFSVFHVKREDGTPNVVKTPIPQTLKTRYIKVSENKTRKFYGLLLDQSGGVHLMLHGGYGLVPLPLKGYDPDTMDLKLISNPLYNTAVYSDETRIYAVAMDNNFALLSFFSRAMSRQKITPAKQVYAAIFPFVFHFDTRGNAFFSPGFECSGMSGFMGLGACLVFYLARAGLSSRKKISPFAVLLVAVTGIYGLIALQFSGIEN